MGDSQHVVASRIVGDFGTVKHGLTERAFRILEELPELNIDTCDAYIQQKCESDWALLHEVKSLLTLMRETLFIATLSPTMLWLVSSAKFK